MESIAVTKQDMAVTRQEPLSPFGLLTALFTEELVRRSGQATGMYRPVRLAYLEEDENEAQSAPPEVHFDLDVDLIVNRLMKQAQAKEKNESKTPAQRILERVIVREREIRMAYPETRRIVIEGGGRSAAVNLPMNRAARQERTPQTARETIRPVEEDSRQTGEGRSTQKTDVPRRSAGLAQAPRPAAMAGQRLARTIPERTLPLATQAMSVPAAGGWMPKYREVHPGYPSQEKKTDDAGITAGSILLPDVMRRRREAALERRETPGVSAFDQEALENALTWAVEDTEQMPETERVLREVRRAVRETLRRNAQRSETVSTAQTARTAMEPPERQEASGQVPAVPILPGAAATRRHAGENAAQEAIPGISAQGFAEQDTREHASATEATQTAVPEPKTAQARAAAVRDEAPSAAAVPQGESLRGAESTAGMEDAGVTAPAGGWTAAPETHVSAEEIAAQVAAPAGQSPTAAVPTGEDAPAAAPAELVYREEAGEAGQRPTHTAAEPQPQQEASETPIAARLPYKDTGERRAASESDLQQTATAASHSIEITESGVSAEQAEAGPMIPKDSSAVPETQTAAEPAARNAKPAETASQAAIPAPEESPAEIIAELVFREEAGEAEAYAELLSQPQGKAGKPSPTAQLAHERAGKRTTSEETNAQQAVETMPSGAEEFPEAEKHANTEKIGPAIPATGSAAPSMQAAADAMESRDDTSEAESVRQASLPAEEGAPATVPAELIYREEAGEAAQTASQSAIPPQARLETSSISKTQKLPREDEGERRAISEPDAVQAAEAAPRSAEIPEAGKQTEAAKTGSTILKDSPAAPEKQPVAEAANLSYDAGPAGDIPQTALPAGEKSPAAAPAELIYREESGEMAESAAQPQLRREANETPTTVRQKRENAGEGGAAPEADIQQATAAATQNLEVSEAEKSAKTAEAGPPIPKTVSTAAPGTKSITEAAAAPEGEPVDTAAQAAIPAQEEAPSAAPAELIYREEAGETAQTAPHSASPLLPQPETGMTPPPTQLAREIRSEQPASEPDGQRTAPAAPQSHEIPEAEKPARTAEAGPSIQKTVSPDAPGTKSVIEAAAAPEAEPVDTAAQAAIPAQEEAPTAAPAEMIYREEASEPSQYAQAAPKNATALQPRQDTGKAVTTAQQSPVHEGERRAMNEPKEQQAAAAIPRDEAPEQETGASESEATSELALPAEPMAQTETPTQLVFREEAGEPAPKGEQRPIVTTPARAARSEAAARLEAMRTAEGKNEHAPHTVPQTLRDIRVAAPNEAALRSSRGETERITEAIPAIEPPPAVGQPELYFATAAQNEMRAAEEATARPTQRPAPEEKAELPNWAKELLEQSGVTDTAHQTAVFNGAANAEQNARQMTWSAPSAMNPVMRRSADRAGPAELMFKERGEKEEIPFQPKISDAELQRTADKVYRMIEERLRRELRRSGR